MPREEHPSPQLSFPLQEEFPRPYTELDRNVVSLRFMSLTPDFDIRLTSCVEQGEGFDTSRPYIGTYAFKFYC